ncbi:MAG: D-Ala-D-Ala carboxypeptidase family metallohydrolase [bacterium]
MLGLERELVLSSGKKYQQISKKEVSFAASNVNNQNNRFDSIENVPNYIINMVDEKIKEDPYIHSFCPEAKNGTPLHIKRELEKFLTKAPALNKDILASKPEKEAINTFTAYSLTSYFIISKELTLLNFNRNKNNVEKQATSINDSIQPQDKKTFSNLVISVIEAEFKKSGLIENKFSPKAKAEIVKFTETKEPELRKILSSDKKIDETGRKKLNKITTELYTELKNKGLVEQNDSGIERATTSRNAHKSPLRPLYSIGIGILESLLILQNTAQPVIALMNTNDTFFASQTAGVPALVQAQQSREQVKEAMLSGGYVSPVGAAEYVSNLPSKFKELATSNAKATPHISWSQLFVHTGSEDAYYAKPPSKQEFQNLYIMANIMEVIRQEVGDKDVSIISGYRSTIYNSTIKGAATKSQHTVANAIDFSVPGMNIQDVEKKLDRLPVSIEYSQDTGKSTIHVDNRMRTQGVISRFAWQSDGNISSVGMYNSNNPKESTGKPLYLNSFDDIDFNYFKDRGLDNITGEYVQPKSEFTALAKAYQVDPSNVKTQIVKAPNLEQNKTNIKTDDKTIIASSSPNINLGVKPMDLNPEVESSVVTPSAGVAPTPEVVVTPESTVKTSPAPEPVVIPDTTVKASPTPQTLITPDATIKTKPPVINNSPIVKEEESGSKPVVINTEAEPSNVKVGTNTLDLNPVESEIKQAETNGNNADNKQNTETDQRRSTSSLFAKSSETLPSEKSVQDQPASDTKSTTNPSLNPIKDKDKAGVTSNPVVINTTAETSNVKVGTNTLDLNPVESEIKQDETNVNNSDNKQNAETTQRRSTSSLFAKSSATSPSEKSVPNQPTSDTKSTTNTPLNPIKDNSTEAEKQTSDLKVGVNSLSLNPSADELASTTEENNSQTVEVQQNNNSETPQRASTKSLFAKSSNDSKIPVTPQIDETNSVKNEEKGNTNNSSNIKIGIKNLDIQVQAPETQAPQNITPKAVKTSKLTESSKTAQTEESSGDIYSTDNVENKWTNLKVSNKFKIKVIQMSERLNIHPDWIMSAMAFETGDSFSASEVNSVSGATGLIQFMDFTAKELGTTTAKLAKMSAEDQLDFVEKYMQRGIKEHKLKDVKDVYMKIFAPSAVGKSGKFGLYYKGTRAYTQNAALDREKKGVITKDDAASFVIERGKSLGLNPEATIS